MKRWVILVVLAGCVDDGGSGEGDAVVVVADAGASADAVDSDATVQSDGSVADVSATDAAAPDAAALGPLEVVTEQGPVRGHPAEPDVVAFLGVPFAAPPVGRLRWRDPERPADRAAVYDAADWAPKCPQSPLGADFEGDEDCLYLNVWSPDLAGEAPTLFFVHGGGNVQGSARQATMDGAFLYDGAALARATGSVVVTVQYRIGHLGWMTHDDLDAESSRSGNYGLLDILEALGWWQVNGAGFGADTSRVLLFGESAGGLNTCVLVASPRAGGLFSAALVQSGGCNAAPRAALDAVTDELLANTGCADVACLRALSPQALIEAAPTVVDVGGRGNPAISLDGDVVPVQPLAAFEARTHDPVPFVVGTNDAEIALAAPARIDAAEYQRLVRATFPAWADRLLEAYPLDQFQTPRAAWIQLISDAKFVCPARTIARTVANAQEERVYRYLFAHHLDSGRLGALGAWHGLELLFVFGLLDTAGYVPSDDEVALSADIQDRWATLAAEGHPGDGWRPYVPDRDNHLRFDGGATAMADGVHPGRCDVWDALLAGQ